MNLGLIKNGIQILAGLGAGFIADEAIATVTKPKNLKGLKKLIIKIGGFVLGAMVADKATDYVENVWNDTASQIKDFIGPEKEVTGEEEEAK